MSLLFFSAILLAAQAPEVGNGCQILYSGSPGEWRFVKVYDAHSGQEILSTILRAGEPKIIHEAPARIRIALKYAGDTQYRPGPTAECSSGAIIKF